MTKKITVKQALDQLNTKYAKTLEMLDSSLDVIEDLEKEVEDLKTNNTILQKDLLKKPKVITCLLYTSPSPRDLSTSRMPSSA